MDVNQIKGKPETGHFEDYGEYPTNRFDQTEGLSPPSLTRKQRRNCKNNKRREVKQTNDLQDLINTNQFSVHRPHLHKFDILNSTLIRKFERLSGHLIKQSQFLTANQKNQKIISGKMFNSGWRKATTKNEMMGISASVPKIAGHEAYYENLQDKLQEMEAFLATRLANMSEKLYEKLRQEHKAFNLPSISSSNFNDIHDFSFASHLSFTLSNFENKPHRDLDSSTYSFGLWLPIDERSGKLIQNDLEVKGGNFMFPDDNFGLNFEGFDGVVEMVWKADELKHHTEKSTSSSHHTRLGISCEIPSTSVQTIVRLQQGFYQDK
ncbi:hypothetical protein MJO28_009695 [Puccinia striiformis f. sp. tritici]|uniref:Tet-like 2OG-Fe(II) oxygenase domain-containing protein n=2 Tax=Puccinia striiformis TaxID=27350 RepID=A0A2S4VM54_9BASI|nr:hypothetical protein MJO28_009695 [Puccinia striiformis f. sp. tritici]POW10559.1 hypothetical protein PSTT_05986 [Puccinia striiformis]